jgi:hypothetical protein
MHKKGFLLYILKYKKVFKEKKQEIIKKFSFRGVGYFKKHAKKRRRLNNSHPD